jgi:invasion protein IalB
MPKRSFFAILLLSAGLAGPALAKDSAAKPDESHPAQASGVTTKAFGGWSLHCQPPHEQGAEPLCVIAQTVQSSGGKLLAIISIGHQHPSDPYNIVVTLPPNVGLPSSVHIRTGGDDKWGVELPWQRCIPGACIAGTELAPATLVHWGSLQTDGKIVFVVGSGDEVSVPITMRGFGDAYKALNQ